MIYYIYHSAFAIELEKNILIFDFYKIPREKIQKEEEFFEKFVKRSDKRVFVFSTHSHYDHFNKKILDWQALNKDITYILSDDIENVEKKENIYFAHEGENFEIFEEKTEKFEKEKNKMKVHTFGSTDLGSSFYVNIENINIFHAGDLHFWHWEDDTELEEKEMKENYISILKQIQKLEKIDIAFTPVDSRLGENVYEGVDIFYNILKPKVIIPMHFSDDYSVMQGLEDRFKNKEVKIIVIDNSMKKIME